MSLTSKQRKIRVLLKEQDQRCFFCLHETHWTRSHVGALIQRGMLTGIRAEPKERRRAIEFRTATLDHIEAVANGGGNEMANYVCACKVCNQLKRNLSIEVAQEFIAYLVSVGAHPHQLFSKTGVWYTIGKVNPKINYTATQGN